MVGLHDDEDLCEDACGFNHEADEARLGVALSPTGQFATLTTIDVSVACLMHAAYVARDGAVIEFGDVQGDCVVPVPAVWPIRRSLSRLW